MVAAVFQPLLRLKQTRWRRPSPFPDRLDLSRMRSGADGRERGGMLSPTPVCTLLFTCVQCWKVTKATGESREDPQESGSTDRPVSLGRSFQANEELRRAQIDGAITWLRSELLEMRSQDLQLAQTLLGLNTEIQRLRRESLGGVEVEGDDQQ
ncbi:protein FAM167A isoform X1 [Acanthopagrus latus]|uniref:protein FAM167A isoform X1 n=1 Tax=Acanthopagrus latus TaxID=8177 RepID=UPI00187C253B|nr:protein FAM167A isoform X1 [Acanthopagrus latus]